MSDAEFTEDAILDGRVVLRQPKRGYRMNVDTVLLAAALPAAGTGDNARVIELGCGVGAALLAVAKAHADSRPDARFFGLERDPNLAALARENIVRNDLSGRVDIIEGDALAPTFDLGQFDRVFFNPPYDQPGEGRAPAEARGGAQVEERPIADWVKVWSNRMNSGASLTLIHRAHRLGDILTALEGRLSGVEIQPIRPSAGAAASRVIVRAWKGSRAPLKLFRGLDLHPDDASKDKYTAEAESVLRGKASTWLV